MTGEGWRIRSGGTNASVFGSVGGGAGVIEKSNAEVRSPHTLRRQGVMFGSRTPNRFYMNRMIEVWSNTSEHTQPPVLHGEMTTIGTRMPRPNGPWVPSLPL